MKKIAFFILMLAAALVARSIPAIPWDVPVSQPDGTTLHVRIIGDEHYCRYATTDGYTLHQNDDGSYTYADALLLNTGVIAHNPELRSQAERSLLTSVPVGVVDTQAVRQARNRAHTAPPRGMQRFDYTKFRGLVILVNYNDRQISMDNPQQFFDAMINQPGYTGYGDMGDAVQNLYSDYTGSVRDYFYDNSNHMFDPHFDVVGPINLDHPVTYANRTSNAAKMFAEVLALADDQIDYSQYDTDGDGVVDMVYFIVAGPGSNSGAPSNYLWPHKSSLSATHDGVKLSTYACSTEMLLVGGQEVIDGIGTVCHEFGHVLGLPDLYDTDYATNGQSIHPGKWEIMASGSYLNNSRTPAGYSLFDKFSLGFAAPQVITQPGEYTLPPLGTTHQGYILPSPNADEKFLLENRQPTKWDAHLPGHGLIVARMDSTSENPWILNKVNDNPEHNYYQLLRAGTGNTTLQMDLDSDPYPGTQNVTRLTNQTTPNLQTWDNRYNPLMLEDIGETDDGNIIIQVSPARAYATLIEDFETMPASDDKNQTGVEGRFSHWDFSKCRVESPGNGLCDGTQALALFKNATAVMTDTVSYAVSRVTLTVNNPNTSAGNITLEYQLPDGDWLTAREATSQLAASAIPAGKVTECNFDLNLDQKVRFRLTFTGGSSTKACYLDNVTLHCTAQIVDDVPTPAVPGDINGDGTVDVSDINILVNIILGKDYTANYDNTTDLNDDGTTDVSDINELVNIILGKH